MRRPMIGIAALGAIILRIGAASSISHYSHFEYLHQIEELKRLDENCALFDDSGHILKHWHSRPYRWGKETRQWCDRRDWPEGSDIDHIGLFNQ